MKMIKITIEAPTRTALDNALRDFLGQDPIHATAVAKQTAGLIAMTKGQQTEKAIAVTESGQIIAKQEQAPKAEPAATTSSEKPDESPAAGADECTYDELKKSIMKLVAIDPKHMREIADSFGVKTFQGTAFDVWPKAKKAVDDKIVALRG